MGINNAVAPEENKIDQIKAKEEIEALEFIAGHYNKEKGFKVILNNAELKYNNNYSKIVKDVRNYVSHLYSQNNMNFEPIYQN